MKEQEHDSQVVALEDDDQDGDECADEDVLPDAHRRPLKKLRVQPPRPQAATRDQHLCGPDARAEKARQRSTR
eukprot:3221189-Rhodomonas_salina.1